jgi:Protein of unknown function (DUF1579)
VTFFKTHFQGGLLLAAGFFFLVSGSFVALSPLQAEEAAAHPAPALALPGFKKIIESGRPSGEKNFVLAKLTGEWHSKTALWAVPGAAPKWTKGVVRNEMTLDDRFLSSSFVGELDVGGNDAMIKGQGLIGYDNAKKDFTSVWVDTLSTSLMTGSGKYDPKTRSIVETGQFTNPLTGTEARFRSELQFTDDDNYKRTIFVVGKSGKETKLIEVDCSRLPFPPSDSKKP